MSSIQAYKAYKQEGTLVNNEKALKVQMPRWQSIHFTKMSGSLDSFGFSLGSLRYRGAYPLLWLCLHESHSCSLSLALTIHFLLTFGARKTYSQLLQMHRLQCSTEPQLGHTFVERHKEGAG